MIKINNKFSISYKDGYFQTQETIISESGKLIKKGVKTHPTISSCHKALFKRGVLKQEMIGVCDTLVSDYPLKLAKASARAKLNKGGFKKKR